MVCALTLAVFVVKYQLDLYTAAEILINLEIAVRDVMRCLRMVRSAGMRGWQRANSVYKIAGCFVDVYDCSSQH